MKLKILQMMFVVFVCAGAYAQTVLNSTNDFNYFDSAWYTGPEVRYSNSVPGIFESSANGVLIHSSRARGDGSIITKSAYTLAGGTAEYIWSGSGGSSFMQSVCGVMTKPWTSDASNVLQSVLLTEYGNLYAGNWLGTPGRVYKTTITFTTNTYALQTIDNLTTQIMATSAGTFDFTQPTYLRLACGDTYDYLNAYLLLQSLTLSLQSPLTVVQTNRAPTTNEVGSPTIPTDPTHFKAFTNGTFQSGIALDPTKMTIVLTHGWNSSPGDWAGYMAQLIQARLGTSTPNIVAWDWSTDAASPWYDLNKIAAKTPGEGLALGTDLMSELGANYSQPIHFIGHSLGTLVNAAAANYLETNGYSGANIQMTLCDDAEIASGFIGNSWQTVATLPTSATPQPFWNHPLPNQFAWADNYISAVGQLHPEAANTILTYLFPDSFPNFDTLWDEFLNFHAYSYEWYDETIQSDASPMGFKWSFENGGFAAAPVPGTIYFQNQNGPELVLVQTNFVGATNYLNDRLTKYIGAYEASFAEIELNGFVQTVGQVAGAIDNTGNMIINLFTSIGNGSLVQSSARPLGKPVPNGESVNNTPAYAWIPISVPSNAVSMSFDFMLQGNGNNDSFQAALNGTNVLSLETVLIQTNVMLNSGLINVSQYAGTNVELFLGIVGGTSTNAQLTVSDLQFYSAALPSLQAQAGGGNFVLSWPLSAQNFSLQTTTNLADPNSWTTLPDVPAIVNLQNAVTNPVSGGSGFYRLIQSQ